MGVSCTFSVLMCVFCVYFLQMYNATRGFTVCDIEGCNCTIKAASWKIINCSLHESKVGIEKFTKYCGKLNLLIFFLHFHFVFIDETK